MDSCLQKGSTLSETVVTSGRKIGVKISNDSDEADSSRSSPHRSSDALSQVGPIITPYVEEVNDPGRQHPSRTKLKSEPVFL